MDMKESVTEDSGCQLSPPRDGKEVGDFGFDWGKMKFEVASINF